MCCCAVLHLHLLLQLCQMLTIHGLRSHSSSGGSSPAVLPQCWQLLLAAHKLWLAGPLPLTRSYVYFDSTLADEAGSGWCYRLKQNFLVSGVSIAGQG